MLTGSGFDTDLSSSAPGYLAVKEMDAPVTSDDTSKKKPKQQPTQIDSKYLPMLLRGKSCVFYTFFLLMVSSLFSKTFFTMAWRSQGRTHQELIESLKHNGMIKNPRVEAAMLKVDRANYVATNPYVDAPQVSNSAGALLTSE